MSEQLRVGIIGGGIGGVALARALGRRGIDFHLFEQAPAFGEVGAGVQMTPNAVKVLKALGLTEALDDIGFLPESMRGINWQTGETLFRTPLKDTFPQVYGAEFYHVHRADLHGILAADLPADKVTFNARCTGIEEQDDGVLARFDDGGEFKADLVVGADGIHSPVRASLWGHDQPQFTGHMCWRALVPVDQHPLPFVGPDAAFWMGPKAHVVTYYVKGGQAVNIVAVTETADWVEESWTEPSSTEELLAAYEGWNDDLIRLFKMTDPSQTFKWGLFDHDPLTRWSTGRATLLGDAAHPMLPFLSQGAAMAIEDAYVLAEALTHYQGDPAAALRAYEQERRPRTSEVQLQARERGRSYHLSTPEELRKRDEAFREAQKKDPNAVGIRAEWIYEYDATTCAERFDATVSA
ncbi:FAD-dependent monooxygenase [Alcanivorax marinus]|uniref:FAD-dependent monooxygenase n=1 Tax=Alloalcanivorax marinus TaxID=1177169 RepID=A0A9Q3UP26_9GAMM|nr:FAD-dependent monooxygenase [Alloalcanivorax marinus]MBM7333931.1 FAD-dependent monooxygenase [Alloalcanivorax marinus]MCC4309009.1 FAD-dependent monooxygenase [Alloalcanivorax marinus]